MTTRTSRTTNKPATLGAFNALALAALLAAAALTGPAATNARAQTPQAQTQQTPAQNPNDALLNALVRKGILTQQEAANLRAETQQQQQPSPQPQNAAAPTTAIAPAAAPKLNLFPGLTSLGFYGDMRLRYEYKEGSDAASATGDRQEINRFRYRLRLGFNGKFAAGWFFGARIETANNNRSTNVTMGSYGNASGKAAANTIYVGQAFAGWTNQDFTFTAGRMANPFTYSQTFVWSDDINVEGLAEQWNHNFGVFTLFANLAQLVYVNNGGTTNAFKTSGAPGTYLFGNQVGARVKLATTMYLQAAPAYYAYSNDARDISGMVPPATPNSANLQTTGLQILDIPLELGLPSIAEGKIPAKIFGDFAANFAASARAKAADTGDGKIAGEKNQDLAWQLGLAIGQLKNKGDWEARAYYQSTDAFALDPNLVDTTEFDARTNMQGWAVMGTYVITPGVSVKLSYYNAQRKNARLPTYGAADLGAANLGKTNIFQADLLIKF